MVPEEAELSVPLRRNHVPKDCQVPLECLARKGLVVDTLDEEQRDRQAGQRVRCVLLFSFRRPKCGWRAVVFPPAPLAPK